MSLAQTPHAPVIDGDDNEHEICQCEFCGGHYPYRIGLSRRYCRWQCYGRDVATNLLQTIRYDHRYCGSCFRKLKDVDPPKPDTGGQSVKERVSPDTPEFGHHHSDVCVGGRTGREHARSGYEWGVGEQFALADPVNGEWSAEPIGEKSTKVCECGVTHHATIDYLVTDLSKDEAIARTERLADAVAALAAEGEHDETFDRDALFDFIRRAKSEPALQGRDRWAFRNALALGIVEAGMS